MVRAAISSSGRIRRSCQRDFLPLSPFPRQNHSFPFRMHAEALAAAVEEPFVLVTGSLYLAGEAIELLQFAREPRADERALNEWAPKV